MRPNSQDQPLEPKPDSGSGADATQLDSGSLAGYPHGFEENDQLRSNFIRHLTLQQLRADSAVEHRDEGHPRASIPRVLVRFWHDSNDVPPDVQACLESWDPLRSQGIRFRMFCDASAASFIATRFGPREVAAFARCRHPAMRSDYLRLCFLFVEGGLYVDADDVLIGDGWRNVFRNGSLKVQPLCYDVRAGSMVPSAELSRTDLPTGGRVFYVNNNPIAAPAGHQVLRRALARSTSALLGDDPAPEIQSTTGPGNLTAALAAYARSAHVNHTRAAVELLLDWEQTAEPRWDLEYRNDARNWRNMDRNKSLGPS
jgi:mannosyltransferase OCH1-like enzyme